MNTNEKRQGTVELERIQSDGNFLVAVFGIGRFTIRKFRHQEITVSPVRGKHSSEANGAVDPGRRLGLLCEESGVGVRRGDGTLLCAGEVVEDRDGRGGPLPLITAPSSTLGGSRSLEGLIRSSQTSIGRSFRASHHGSGGMTEIVIMRG